MKKITTGLILSAILCFFMSCATTSTYTLSFAADKQINDDVLLPVDIIVAKDPVMNSVVEIGPEEWFGHQTREVLVERELYPLAISGGEERVKKIIVDKEISRIIIFADYENSNDRDDQQLIINTSDRKTKYLILITENKLEIEK